MCIDIDEEEMDIECYGITLLGDEKGHILCHSAFTKFIGFSDGKEKLVEFNNSDFKFNDGEKPSFAGIPKFTKEDKRNQKIELHVPDTTTISHITEIWQELDLPYTIVTTLPALMEYIQT